jgi:hypothetical protein
MHAEMIAESLDDLTKLPLGEATAQDIQLELIRRWQFNAFDGERVAAKLLEHRDLWESVMMDRLALSGFGDLPAMGLIKLRDLPYNEWNVDTLYMLAPELQFGTVCQIFLLQQLPCQLDHPLRDVDTVRSSAAAHCLGNGHQAMACAEAYLQHPFTESWRK